MFIKIAKSLIKDAKKEYNLSAALKYILLVHRNLLEYSLGHLKILLENVQCEFEETSNMYYFSNILYYQYQLNH